MHARFTGDEALFYGIVSEIASLLGLGPVLPDAQFPLLGPPLTGGEAKHPGPLFYYLMTVSQFFSPTPEAANLWVAFLGAGSVWLFWAAMSRGTGTTGATLSALLLSLSPWSAFYADRLWNSNVVGLFVAVAFWGMIRVCNHDSRKSRSGSRAIALVVASCTVMPQFHMSAPIVWAAILAFFYTRPGGARPKLNWRWAALGLALGATAYTPTAVHEWRTGFGNIRAFLAESSAHAHWQSFLRVPLNAARFLTVDSAYQELQGYWGGATELKQLRTALGGSPARPFHVLRLLGLLASFALAFWAIRQWLRVDKANSAFLKAAIAGSLTAMLLLLLTRKPFYPHYLQPLLPFYFAAYAFAFSRVSLQRPSHRAAVLAGMLAFALTSIDALYTINTRLDSVNGLRAQREVLARVESDARSEGWPDAATVQLTSDFPLFIESYSALGRPRRFLTASGSVHYHLQGGHTPGALTPARKR